MNDVKEVSDALQRHDFGIRKMELVELIAGVNGSEGEMTSAVTMVKTPTSTVIVDSGARHVRDELVRIVRENEAKIDKVNVLVTSTAHDLHSGNDDLFVHCLQHIVGDDWSKVPIKTNRRVAITTPYHWIDKYLLIIILPSSEGDSLALLAHFPAKEEMLEPSTAPYAGKVVGIAGISIPTKDDPTVQEALSKARNMPKPKGEITSIEKFLAYCDHVIPAYGPMFPVRG